VSELLSVDCQPRDDDFVCSVRVGDDPGVTTHEVTVKRDVLERLNPGASDPTSLVSRSFEYLLAREPRESIMRSFDLPVIGNYFSTYEADIRA
jgi:hypothetical protein